MINILNKIKYDIKLNNNNWRKLHGYPMIRDDKRKRNTLFNLKKIHNPMLCVKVDNPELIKKFYRGKDGND